LYRSGHGSDENTAPLYAAMDVVRAQDHAAIMRKEQAINEIEAELLRMVIPEWDKCYDELKKEAERLWVEMIPFARCTHNPEKQIQDLYETIVWFTLSPIYNAVGVNINHNKPYPDVSYGDVLDAENAISAAEYMKTEVQNRAGSLDSITVSVEFGPFELKFKTTSIELEYVAGAAGRIQFDWKSKQLELGVGAGVKGNVQFMGAEAKGYVNVAFDMRSGDVTDLYLSGEVKGSLGTSETGIQARASAFNGLALSATAKQKLGPFAIEHEAKLFER